MNVTNEELLLKIRNQITAYQMNVRSDNKAHRYDINDRAEAFTIPLFKLLFGWEELRDLNKDGGNVPGIDLGDEKNKVAIQVTSETTLDKVKDTIEKFVKWEHFNKYQRLVIFMIQEKQRSYKETSIKKACAGKVGFDPKADILDLSDLMQFVKGHQFTVLEAILELFQKETGFIEAISDVLIEIPVDPFSAPTDPPYEEGFLNLIEIGFPDTLYIADWNFTREQLGTKKRNDRKLVQEALEQKGLRFAVDWVTTERQIVTFHDLDDEFLPLAEIIDQGAVTRLETDEFFESPIYRNKFLELLQRCLQQKLYHLGIQWQHDEKEYIFIPQHGEKTREIKWVDLRTGTRTVYKQIPDLKDKSKTYCHEHFAFDAKFYKFDNRWYLAVTPDWFYSSDGYKRAWYVIEEKRKYKKLVEKNQQVSTHVRFIQAFIATNDPGSSIQMDLFGQSVQPRIYDFLWIKDREEVKGMPRLPDTEWSRPKNADLDENGSLFSKSE